MKSINLTHLYKRYKGLWVALTDSYKVVSADKDIRKAHDTAVKKGYSKPRLFRVPQKNMPFVG